MGGKSSVDKSLAVEWLDFNHLSKNVKGFPTTTMRGGDSDRGLKPSEKGTFYRRPVEETQRTHMDDLSQTTGFGG